MFYFFFQVHLALPFLKSKYDLSTIIKRTSKKFLVHNVPGIKRAFVENKSDHILLRTEGINFHKVYELEHLLDVNKVYTNNIAVVAKMLGIEAAQKSIIREIRAVQSAYDIKVDFRHLSLLADYFTCEGTYKACSRFAIASCSSPMQKITYETSLQFLKSALVNGEKDKMNSPSCCVSVGQLVKIGTGLSKFIPKLPTKIEPL